VGIGLPVYNGENFVGEAIESFLGQTFSNFELVITDNASTDGTEQICRSYEALDPRVSYHRNPQNLGASANYTRCFELARGEYFKWAAHDDVCLPEFLGSCVEALDRDRSAVLCYTRVQTIDAAGRRGKKWPSRPSAAADEPDRRFEEVLTRQDTFPIFGLMRRDVLAGTPLLGPYPAHDRPLLAELSLHGSFVEIDNILFLEREHPQRSVRAYDFRKPHEAVAWYDTQQAGKLIFPAWRLLKEYRAAVHRASLSPGQSARSQRTILQWTVRHRSELIRDLYVAARRQGIVGRMLAHLYEWRQQRNWSRRARLAARDLTEVLPLGEPVILVDEALFEAECFSLWRTVPFPERDGEYAGPPPDAPAAMGELERLRERGCGYVAFVWPAFWWLEYYGEFREHLSARYDRVLENDRVVVFDVRVDRNMEVSGKGK
jgi:glycosyltransferase involved in cell wall biosynthesis